MTWMSKLVTKSPFGPLQEHQRLVQKCAEQAIPMIESCQAGELEELARLAALTSKLESDADDLKVKVRDQLPRSLFMPVSRGDLLKVLSAQDSIADCAEDLAVLITMRPMEPLPQKLADILREHVTGCVEVVRQSTRVVDELDTLVSASFTGPDANRVLEMMTELDRMEHEADKVGDKLAKAFFQYEDEFKPAAIFLWMKIFNKIGDLANFAESMINRIRLFMAS